MSTNIECPRCEHQFSVEEAIAQKVEKGYAVELQIKENSLKKEYAELLQSLKGRETKLANSEKTEAERLNVLLAKKEKEIQAKLENELKAQFGSRMKALQEENKEKSTRLKSVEKQELELQKREQKLKEAMEDQQMALDRIILEEKQKLQGQMEDRLEEKVVLKLKEKEMLINQLKKNIEEMKRKSDQGSMQAQGEAQELAIEDLLRERFPIDNISEVGKGTRGADCMQTVRGRSGQDCGLIIYESKRTKTFSKTWLAKLKQDALSAKANIPVLVTEAMPEGLKGIFQMDGVWVTDFQSIGTLAMILRFALIKEHHALGTQENKGEKMQLLYDYLTGNEFRMQVQAILDGFEEMHEQIRKQRRSMEASWKNQEKALELVIHNTIGLHSSVRGIAGAAVAAIPMLELQQ
jgi:hypothetical protein